MAEDARTIAEMLIRQELALKELYQAYALKFPSVEGFWLRLAADEQLHADWLGSLVSKLGPDKVLPPCCWPRSNAVESSIKYIQVQILRAHEAEITGLAALSIAGDLENSLLEKEFFKVAEGISPQFKAVLGRLIADTEGHRQAVLKAINEAKAKVSDPV